MKRLVILLALVACAKKSDPPLATLEAIVAQVERMPAAGAAWGRAAVGDGFVLGSAVRTGHASHAKLRIGKNGRLDVDADAVVYFTRTPGKKHDDLKIETGAVELETGDDALGFGEAMLEPHAHARIARTPEGLSVTITLGHLELEDGPAGSALGAGTTVMLPAKGAPVVTATAGSGARPAAQQAAPAGTLVVNVSGRGITQKTARGSEPVAIGEHAIEPGTELAIPDGATVEVSRDGARAIVVGEAAVRVGAPDGALVTAIAGDLTLVGDTAEAAAAVPGGTLRARNGSEAAAHVDATGTTVDVHRGEVAIQTAKGEQTVAAGESVMLAPGGDITRAPQPPAHAVVTITAGESPVLHDPHAPAAVGVAFGAGCTGGGILELAKDRAFKRVIARSATTGESANVLVPAGAFSYRVRCHSGHDARGTIRVVRDSGRAPLPKNAARTLVEADGREYTILYQNLLPELTLSWRNARAAASYTFVIQGSGDKPRRFASTTPRTSLRAGELGEGSYTFWVETSQPVGRSDNTKIVIEFDNAAPSASLEGIDVKDGKAHVRGVVIEGSTVSAGGADVALDRHRRFDADLAPHDGTDSAAIRIAHPKLGVHYYIVAIPAPAAPR